MTVGKNVSQTPIIEAFLSDADVTVDSHSFMSLGHWDSPDYLVTSTLSRNLVRAQQHPLKYPKTKQANKQTQSMRFRTILYK